MKFWQEFFWNHSLSYFGLTNHGRFANCLLRFRKTARRIRIKQQDTVDRKQVRAGKFRASIPFLQKSESKSQHFTLSKFTSLRPNHPPWLPWRTSQLLWTPPVTPVRACLWFLSRKVKEIRRSNSQFKLSSRNQSVIHSWKTCLPTVTQLSSNSKALSFTSSCTV